MQVEAEVEAQAGAHAAEVAVGVLLDDRLLPQGELSGCMRSSFRRCHTPRLSQRTFKTTQVGTVKAAATSGLMYSSSCCVLALVSGASNMRHALGKAVDALETRMCISNLVGSMFESASIL